jgi:hypothetical protein
MLYFTKFSKNSHENVCPLMICWLFTKMFAVYKNVGTLLKCWRFTKMLALNEKVGAHSR